MESSYEIEVFGCTKLLRIIAQVEWIASDGKA
jgi:hypothetical protein